MIPTPPQDVAAAWVPSPRYAASLARGFATWTARCPHGPDAMWTAIRRDTRADITCHCTCPEEDTAVAPVSPYGPLGAGVVIPMPPEETQ